MTFNDVLSQTLAMLQQHGRVSYRALKRQFALDDAFLEDLKYELIKVQQRAVDQDGTMLVWTGEPGAVAASVSASVPSTATSPATSRPAQAPLAYTPAYLAEKIFTSRSALEGERKQVTVLFADLKGSMELLADRDPEEARRILDPVLERLMAAVHRYEGTVNQVMGDGIMALFGAPLAHEDHALRACYAALAMQAAMQTYAESVRHSHGVTVQIRVGLNSGAVVVRAIGNDLRMDYSAVGQTTHLAARMEQLATPGSILLTADTLRLAEGLVQVKALGFMPVKGLAEPVEVFELLGASTLRGRFQARVAGGLTQFVGRETERAALVQALERAGAGHGQVVALVGEAGVGKSRLVYEFVHSHHLQGWRRLESAALSYSKATPYVPLIDLLRRYTHIEAHDDMRAIQGEGLRPAPTQSRQRIAEQVERLAQHALRGELWDKALTYSRQAGEKAVMRSAYREAVGYFEQALSVLSHLPETRATQAQAIDLRLVLRSAFHASGDIRRQLTVLQEAEALAVALARLEQAVGICYEADFPVPPGVGAALGASYILAGRIANAVPLLTQALEQAVATDMVDFQALCSLPLGEAQMLAGHLEEAHVYAERALALARENGERGHEAYALQLLGDIAARHEPLQSESAEIHYRQALTLAEALGMRPLQAHCHRSLGTLYATLGQRKQARTVLTMAMEMYRAMGMPFWLPQAEATLAQMSGDREGTTQ